MSLIHQPATEQLAELTAERISAVELTQLYLAQIKRHDGRVGAFLKVNEESALIEAKRVDEDRAAGKPLGKLAGLPVAVKDLLCTRGEPTTCASKMLQNFRPPYDATVIAKLKAADAILIGRTNLDEFAMGGSTENSALGKTRNPWDLTRVPGGSSGGSAACMAASMAALAIGTDTGGSIRQPAALCGITGLKPTYGRVSRYGLVAFASSLDQIGPMTRTARDAALLLEVIAGHDPLDSTSAPVAVPEYTQALDQPLAGLKLGVVKEHFGAGVDAEVADSVQAALKVYEELGATLKEVSLPHNKYGIATYYVIAPCEASSNLARFDGVRYGYRADEKGMLAELEQERAALVAAGKQGTEKQREAEQLDSPLVRLYRQSRSEGFGPEVKRRIMLGSYALSAGYYDAYYLKALKVRRLIRQDYDEAFRDVDLIVGPTTPSPAFKIGEKVNDPLAMYLEDLFTVTLNLAGLGGISIPCGLTKSGLTGGGLPIGLQLQAPAMQETRLLAAAHLFQQATDWHARRPSLS